MAGSAGRERATSESRLRWLWPTILALYAIDGIGLALTLTALTFDGARLKSLKE
jgi:hypothetical protein